MSTRAPAPLFLQRAQHSERQYLSKAFQRVGDLERRRAGTLQQAFTGFAQLYRWVGARQMLSSLWPGAFFAWLASGPALS